MCPFCAILTTSENRDDLKAIPEARRPIVRQTTVYLKPRQNGFASTPLPSQPETRIVPLPFEPQVLAGRADVLAREARHQDVYVKAFQRSSVEGPDVPDHVASGQGPITLPLQQEAAAGVGKLAVDHRAGETLQTQLETADAAEPEARQVSVNRR